MIQLIRTDGSHPALPELIPLLDAYLSIINGEKDAFFTPHNQIQSIPYFVIAVRDGMAVGCGGMKPVEFGAMEIKRMFVRPEARGAHVGSQILRELEAWARELGYAQTALETCKTMTDAVRLYERNGYKVIPNYGPYVDVTTSVCMAKAL